MLVEIWSDVICPWCYLGKRRFDKALAQVPFGDEVEVVHRSFQLDPSAPVDRTVETSRMLAERYRLGPEQVEQMQREMEQRAAADGLEYHLDGQHTGNTVPAHRVLHLAKARGRQDAVLEAIFRAHFTEQRSVFEAASLQRIAVSAGLDGAEVAAVLAGGDYADDVRADLEQARAYGITGVPFFVLDRRLGVSGAQPVEVLVSALEQARATVPSTNG